MKQKRGIIFKAGPSNLALFFAGMMIGSWALFVLATGFPLVQWVYYGIFPATSSRLAQVLGSDITEPETGVVQAVNPLPPLDEGLPLGHRVIIPKIGVETAILEEPQESYENALQRGVWRVPEYAMPDQPNLQYPIILVAHRFGYLAWTQEYRLRNSFFRLPKLTPGDEVELIWDQRKYTYKVTRVEEGEDITDYEADLILYTCKFLVSPVRIFAYADRTN